MSDLYETTNRTQFFNQLNEGWYKANSLFAETNSSIRSDINDAVNAVVPTGGDTEKQWRKRDKAYRDGGGTIEYAITGNTATMKWRPSSTPLAYTEMYLLEWSPPHLRSGGIGHRWNNNLHFLVAAKR